MAHFSNNLQICPLGIVVEVVYLILNVFICYQQKKKKHKGSRQSLEKKNSKKKRKAHPPKHISKNTPLTHVPLSSN